MKRSTVIVGGPLAFAMSRAEAAKNASVGLEVMTLPRLAARLAGGFVQPADANVLMPAIASALAEGGFAELHRVLDRPGLPRAIYGSLISLWRSDCDLGSMGTSARLTDMLLIERRVRSWLPACYLTYRDLRDAAIAKSEFAPRVLGAIALKDFIDIDPVWRPLLVALARYVDLSWTGDGAINSGWFPRKIETAPEKEPETEKFFSCSDPNAEVVEALRWVRLRLSGGEVKASDLAICATITATYDEAMLVNRRSSGLPIYFSHGVPALSTSAGQTCAALADLLTRGINRSRVMRFLFALGGAPALTGLPTDWWRSVPPKAALESYGAWREALHVPELAGENGPVVASIILPLIELLEKGPDLSAEIGDRLLVGETAAVWRRALGLGPSYAIAFTLEHLRLPDEGDPAGAVVWGSADHVATAPRERVRLLGLSTNVWPRRAADDAILPNHIVSRTVLAPTSLGRYDRACFYNLRRHSSEFVASYARRGARGTLQTPGPLWPVGQDTILPRLRVPEHAFSENDRLMARRVDANIHLRVLRTRSTWSQWHSAIVTPHDGIISKDHPAILRALGQPLSSAAMRRLLRDQLAFVWSEGMGWREHRTAGLQLALSPADFGTLVHEVLARALAILDSGPGIAGARIEERQHAFLTTISEVDRRWTLERTIPPARLWQAILDMAMSLGMTALLVDEELLGKVDTWTEVGFGGTAHGDARMPPWTATDAVNLKATNLQLSGRIDRLDVAKSRNGFMVTDYKTATKVPPNRSILDGGRNVQPLLYVAAAQTHLPDAGRRVARVVYLHEGEVAPKMDGEALEQAITDLSTFAMNAEEMLRSGVTLPGPDAMDGEAAFRLALPADMQLYRRTKSAAFSMVQAKIAAGWRL